MEAPADSLQDHYLEIIHLSTSEHLKIYNKAIVGLTENKRYDMTISKQTEFYQ